ncbi:ABC transporter ATP-binding protein [Rhodococcus sp. 06-470-2]|uniref:ABC transporter ATP-binding protein n=1 Tax=unclassified Rhodococcus (in: high G+C Gram-positive bacteria) TaxID=192944 RepID=UPI000B9C081C|nr:MULTISPECIES: ATP-binding cassette domain-containing protein [unclassified Rhodococcus (in: high G+C Gram-positive bacteria)]OZC61053.1 ABC transporter ATP-binding protein [Rhodococcus sp. 06-470-2]OZE06016.1 ABC transporter ATP-binding protein [Rhodococcus sp. 05-2255-3B1]OZE09225.1 ABC transporter ATP-binding protein [Rhodococcus sp. 05-2255-3C]OZE18169.1 ABC transporter ATP-binding protein [Rhodococcus sp. 05-2255-2A2]OZE55694.1 ABC transporter ATP-binding protein [Rhodococcus sp. 05-222
MPSSVLFADRVDFVRGGRYLLSDATIRVEEGEHWVLLGANGAGKSTLLSLLGAVVHPTHGSVHVLGHRLGRVDMRELRTRIGHVDPRLTVEAPLTLFQVVLTGLTNTPDLIPRWSATEDQIARAHRLIGSLGVAHRTEASWHTLSQGERGRALIARALLPDPAVLLLDEPATGLDLAAREQLLGALDSLRAEHPSLASILVTHHLEEIPVSTTHALLIRNGKVLAQGAVDAVLTTANISECFDHPIEISTQRGRWVATAANS